jgi:hypothetical protein
MKEYKVSDETVKNIQSIVSEGIFPTLKLGQISQVLSSLTTHEIKPDKKEKDANKQ